MYGIGICATFKNTSLCLWKDEDCISSTHISSHGMHTVLLSQIEFLLEPLNLSFKDIDFIVVDTGPASSFTGLRLSLAMIKSWAMVQKITLYETSSTWLLYEELLETYPNYYHKYIAVGYFGFQNRLYIQEFFEGQSISSVQDMSIDLLEPYITNKPQQYTLIGSILEYLDITFTNTKPLYTPQICFSKIRKKIAWADLMPQYYRLTSAQEGK